jgi:biopolymer transport protein ExbD
VRKPKRIGVNVDMTPMVDVAFLLLIFFMTTTTFKPPDEVEVQLPSSNAEYKVPETNVVILTINRASEVYVQDDPRSPISKVPADQLIQQLGDWVNQARRKNPRARWIVRADKGCDYGVMEDVMNVLQEQRTNRFVLMTDGESGGKEKDLPATDKKPEGADAGQLFGKGNATIVAEAGAGATAAPGGRN